MNILLVANKRYKKTFEAVIQDSNNTLLGCEYQIRNGFIRKVTDDYNPHIIVIHRNAPVKDDIQIKDVIALLRIKKPNMRIIYVYGNVSDHEHFDDLYNYLVNNCQIYDIIYKKKTNEQMLGIIENPMTLKDLLNENKEEESDDIVVEEPEEEEKEIEATEVDIENENSLYSNFDIMEVTEYNEDIPEIIEIKNIVIGVTELMHHSGCTHTSFEICEFLSERNRSCCVILNDYKTYKSLADFYQIPDDLVDGGFTIKQHINVYPYSQFAEVKEKYNYIIIDFGYFRMEQHSEDFHGCHIKIMLCSSAEWDISTLMNYINLTQVDYIRDINYCFYPISQTKFIAYNKKLIKGKCKGYRLQTSQDWLQPCNENKDVYLDILKRYTNIVPAKRKRRKKNIKTTNKAKKGTK